LNSVADAMVVLEVETLAGAGLGAIKLE